MKTQIFKNPIDYPKAAEIIKSGGLVAFPTETVYGLGADAFNEPAVRKIFEVKGRPNDNPLILHVSNLEELLALTALVGDDGNRPESEAGAPETAPPTMHDTTPSVVGDAVPGVPHFEVQHKNKNEELRSNSTTPIHYSLFTIHLIKELYQKFMPGPLTLVLPKHPSIPGIITAGLPTVAIRIPANPIAGEFIAACGTPIAAPSANISGRPSCTTFEHVFEDMNGKIDAILDGGSCNIGLESTILDLSVPTPTILRTGGISAEQLQKVIGTVDIVGAHLGAPEEKPKSPGLKYRHYAPKAPLILVDNIEEAAEKYPNKKVGKLHKSANLETYAATLYDNLRRFDIDKVDLILAEKVDNTGLGVAINNRLTKATMG
ncbi:MAG: L-threonylcarbamoyladenylate synthase [Oscillospiraceae bacterium]|nr:L-threonylcarbamoyladenylate synthase [Oscillospiraceae bacterium]